jgi:hypothetical protein
VREPNDKTKLLTLRREMKETVEELHRVRMDLGGSRARATRAETDAAEWKRRFDLLLSRVRPEIDPVVRWEGEK